MTLLESKLRPAMRRAGWSPAHLIAGIALTLAGVWVTSDAWSDILAISLKDEESSHALLVPLVCAWLVWVRRGRFAHCRPVGKWIGPLLTAAGAALYVVGDKMLFQVFWHGGAVLVAVGGLLTLLGRDVLVQFLPAFVALGFMLPVPGRIRQNIALPLQTATATAAANVLDFVGMPVEQSGNLLRVNGVDVAVAEACNGMRMTFALIMVCYTFAFITPLKGYVRALILLLSPLSAMLCNIIRLVPTVYVYGHFSSDVAARFHDLSGWVMLLVSFLLLMGVVKLLRWTMTPMTNFTLAYD